MFDKCPRVPGLTKIDRTVRLLEATNVEIKENDKKKKLALRSILALNKNVS